MNVSLLNPGMNFQQAFGGRVRNWIWEAGLLLVLPLVFYRGFAEQFSTPKLFLTKCLIITGLAVWALSFVWAPASRRIRFPLGLPLLAFSVAALISSLASPVPRFSLLEVEFALCGPAWVLLLVSWNNAASAVRRIVVLISVAGAMVAGIALIQRFGFDPVLLVGYQVDWGSMVARMHLYSTFGNPNFVGGYLIGTIFPAVALAWAEQARWAKVFWWSFTLIMLAAIVETGSHGAWVGLAAGLAAALVAIIPRSGSRLKEAMRWTGSESIKVSAPPFAYWLLALLTLTLAERVAAQLNGRVYLWRFSWPMFGQHPVLGSGWGTYQLFYLELQGKFLAAHPQYVGYWTNNRLLHNDPMQLLLEAGVFGFAAFVWVLWEFGREAMKAWRQTGSAHARWAIAASVGGVTAVLTNSLFNYQLAVPPTYILLFTLLAIPGLLLEAEVEKAGPGQPKQVLAAHHKPWLRALKAGGSTVILVAAAALVWQQTRVLISERAYQTALDMEDHNDSVRVEKTYRRSINFNDLNGRAHFGLSRVLYSANRSPEALQEIARAEETYADSHQEVLRGRILDQMGRNNQALAAYRHALWLDPTLTSVQEDIERLSKSP